MIWAVAAALVLLWPAGDGGSLGVKAARFAADPFHRLPLFPPPIPMGLGDDADVVAAHDTREMAYYEARDASRLTRVRMAVRDFRDPLERATQRQALIGLAVLGALLVWRLGDARARPEADIDEG